MISLNKPLMYVCIALLLCMTSVQHASGAEHILSEKLGDFTLVKPVATYTPQNLFELINGQAVFYLSYGFVGLEHAFYKKGDAIYQVDLYELRSNLAALGSYRQQRDMDAEPLSVGTEGSIIDYLTVFFKDKYYVEIIPFEGDVNDIISEMTTLATGVAAVIPGKTELPAELSLFPSAGKTPGSEIYIGENLLSYTFLGHGITAEYTGPDGKTFKAFISLAKSAEDAINISSQFGEKLNGSETVALADGSVGNTGEMPYRGRAMIVPFQSYAVGTLGHTDDKSAISLISQITKNISFFTSGK